MDVAAIPERVLPPTSATFADAATGLAPRHGERTAIAHEKAVANSIKLMQRRLADPLPLSAMADVACMSPFHYSRVFRGVTGTPPGQFLSALRLDRAKALLAGTRLSVTDICFEVGYQSFGTFITRFRNLVGVCPTAFREAHVLHGSTPLGLLREWLLEHRRASDGAPIACEVTTPAGFDGAVFIALFRERFPAGDPIWCQVVNPGRCWLDGGGSGGGRAVLALGASWSSTLGELLVLQGRLLLARASMQGASPVRLGIGLRPPTIFDPPLLTAFPLVLIEELRRQAVRRAS